MIRQSTALRRPNRLANRKASPFSKQSLAHAFRVMAPALFALTFASVAHAQGTMDFSGAQTLMGTFKTFAIYAGAVICFGGLIFAGIRMMSGRFQDAIPGLFGALFGAGVLGWGAGWISSLPGQSFGGRTAMTKRGEPSPINQALNRPRARLGLDLSAWMAIVFVCVTVFLVGFRLLAMLAFPTLAVGAWLIVRKHPKMFQLWGLSLNQKSYYDPRKQ